MHYWFHESYSRIHEKRACTCGNRHKLGGIKRYQFNITP
nr:MAG TPA: hypothetical protein [Caudoviricetes sp.]